MSKNLESTFQTSHHAFSKYCFLNQAFIIISSIIITMPTFFKRLSFRIPPQRGNPGLKLIAFSPSLCAGTGFFSLVLCVGGGGGVCVGADGVLLGALSL